MVHWQCVYSVFLNCSEGSAVVRVWWHWSWWVHISWHCKNTSHYSGSRQANTGHVWTGQGIYIRSIPYTYFIPRVNTFLYGLDIFSDFIANLLHNTYTVCCTFWCLYHLIVALIYWWFICQCVTVVYMLVCKYKLCFEMMCPVMLWQFYLTQERALPYKNLRQLSSKDSVL